MGAAAAEQGVRNIVPMLTAYAKGGVPHGVNLESAFKDLWRGADDDQRRTALVLILIATGAPFEKIVALTGAFPDAMAIAQARLYDDMQREEGLRIAREIQRALLPQSDKILPFVNACSLNLPCLEPGGDYIDYFDLAGGRLGFAIGDVAGKGMPAALLVSMLKGIFCDQTLLDLPLPIMIANVNCSLAMRDTGNRFVTFFFGILDSEGNCTYTNAGHNPPFLIRSDGSMRDLTEGGMVLGLFPQAQFESSTIRMEPGDHLVLLTDGVPEARNVSGQEFGEQRIRELLKCNAKSSAAIMLRCLKEQLASFSANTPQDDDITMMILGYREPNA
jgi:sigma-B regulation protein RsbU (phosphoserine phosphatase)